MGPRAAYAELIRRSRELATLASCSAVLGWDEQTYMPPGGAQARGDQMALLAGLHHERATDPRVGELLGDVEGSDLVTGSDSPEAANVRELRRDYDRRTRLPRSLVEELAKTTTIAQQEWVAARQGKNFPQFRPWLEAIFALKRREAECLGAGNTGPGNPPRRVREAPRSGEVEGVGAFHAPDRDEVGIAFETPYDALLDEYEPGARARDLAAGFDALRREVVPLVDAIAGSGRRPDPTILNRDFPVDRQKLLGEMVAAAVGFDFRRGRLDTTAHPFCSGIGPGDCRITTRYNPRDFGESFFGVLHEVGHGLYEQGLAPGHAGTPMGEAASLGIHESQSRLWENAVGRGRPFWAYWLPVARRVFRESLGDVDPEAFHFAINRVAPSPIRVQADEVTYNLHILARFDLERALLGGDLPVGDLPGAWAEVYRKYLGITPADDAEGCLQDIHWAAGLVGYFPTYTLGNLFAAQLFARAREDLAGLDRSVARGDFAGLLGWLQSRIHAEGRRFRSAALVERATGAAPDHRPLVRSLRQKYGELYGI